MTRSNASPAGACLPTRARSAASRVVACMVLFCIGVTIAAQPPGEEKPPATNTSGSSLETLVVAQGKVADRYTHLEQLLIRMAELEATSNPQRAALLKRAAQQSSERLTRQQLDTLIKLLTPPAQLKRAIDEQQQVVADLRSLLELLQSENRSDRLKSEQARVREYIKDVERLIRLQKGVQGRTEGGDDAPQLANDQLQVADRTGELAQRIRENEEGQRPGDADRKNSDSSQDPPGSKEQPSPGKNPKDGKQGEPKTGDPSADTKQPGGAQDSSSKSGDQSKSGKKGEQPAGQQDKSKSDSKDKSSDKAKAPAEKDDTKSPTDGKSESERTPGDNADKNNSDKKNSAKKSSGKNSKQKSAGKKGSPSDSAESDDPSESGDSPPSPAENPARKRLEAAQERMREAQLKLAEANRKDASQEQQQAREELEKAKAELEQILRQLREEEVERTLALLEGRFRQMLDSQLRIYESTKRLDKVPADKRTRELDIQASKLSFDESKLAVDADKALLLLREEGSSVAFPETVELVRDDMLGVAERLSSAKVDRVTQGLEEEIIQSLEELIAALQKAQQELKEKKQQQPQQPMEPGDPSSRPLVDKLAELRMIRSLQFRVNARTQRYARLLEDVDDPVGRANNAELRQSILKLAEMEQRVFEITRNIVLGKNE